MTIQVRDRARFDEQADGPALIMACFACGVCLQAADLVTVSGGAGARTGISHCSGCGTVNRVELSDAQTNALLQLPRGRAFVHLPHELW